MTTGKVWCFICSEEKSDTLIDQRTRTRHENDFNETDLA